MIERKDDPSSIKPTKREPPPGILIPAAHGAHRGGEWDGSISGHALDADAIVLFVVHEEVGEGPTLHVHPYDELFIISEGRARFTVGDDTFEAGAGDVVKDPAAVPHAYENIGPRRLRTIDIHLNREWVQTNLA